MPDALAKSPMELATQHTLRFVRAHLGSERRRVLEVGCGSGRLAAALLADGHDVVALDADEQCVIEARARGVDARLARWPEFADSAFDAVLFTRSLHHIHPLDRAVQRAAELTKSDGILLLEDFAYHDADESTATWLRRQLDRNKTRLTLDRPTGERSFAAHLLRAENPIEAWFDDYANHLHHFPDMLEAVRREWTEVQVENGPYLFRYLVDVLPDDDTGARIAQEILDEEQVAIATKRIVAIGRRLVACRQKGD